MNVNPAIASNIYLCVEEKAEGAVKSGGTTGGSCKTGYDQVALPSEEKEQKKLIEILPYLSFEEKGVDSKPTIRVSGANVQLVSGAGKTSEVNGEGNLVVGYDEVPGEQTGSNNLVLGGEQKYTSYGDIVGGFKNSVLGPYDTVFGRGNTASAAEASVAGGVGNQAKGEASSIAGGWFNTAEGLYSAILGGSNDKTTGERATIAGGWENQATGFATAVGGGHENTAINEAAAVAGGYKNTAKGVSSSVTGGKKNTATVLFSSIDGGESNNAEGTASAILGGKEITLTTAYSTSP